MEPAVCPKLAIYPGSFDPVTNGHLDIIKRGQKLFDRIIVAVLYNSAKQGLFTIEERVEMIRNVFKDHPKIAVDSFGGLLVDYARQQGAHAILRGMRAISDFDYEFQLALMNRRLNREVQTVFLMTGLRWVYISSSVVKEAARFGGDVSQLVPPVVNRRLKEKFRSNF